MLLSDQLAVDKEQELIIITPAMPEGIYEVNYEKIRINVVLLLKKGC
ncbi:MAG: hypothetical protein ACP5I6_05760 [Caldisphaera sp.]|jgi:hypothetical protein